MLTTRNLSPRAAVKALPRRILTVRPWINVSPIADGDDERRLDRRVVKLGEVVDVEASLAEDLVSSGHARYHEHGDQLPTHAEVRVIRPCALSADGKRLADAEEPGARAVAFDTVQRVPVALARDMIERGVAQPWALC